MGPIKAWRFCRLTAGAAEPSPASLGLRGTCRSSQALASSIVGSQRRTVFAESPPNPVRRPHSARRFRDAHAAWIGGESISEQASRVREKPLAKHCSLPKITVIGDAAPRGPSNANPAGRRMNWPRSRGLGFPVSPSKREQEIRREIAGDDHDGRRRFGKSPPARKVVTGEIAGARRVSRDPSAQWVGRTVPSRAVSRPPA